MTTNANILNTLNNSYDEIEEIIEVTLNKFDTKIPLFDAADTSIKNLLYDVLICHDMALKTIDLIDRFESVLNNAYVLLPGNVFNVFDLPTYFMGLLNFCGSDVYAGVHQSMKVDCDILCRKLRYFIDELDKYGPINDGHVRMYTKLKMLDIRKSLKVIATLCYIVFCMYIKYVYNEELYVVRMGSASRFAFGHPSSFYRNKEDDIIAIEKCAIPVSKFLLENSDAGLLEKLISIETSVEDAIVSLISK